MTVYTLPLGQMQTNCHIIASEQNNCFVVDPGGEPEKLNRFLEEKGLTPKGILLTHGHFDHIGAVKGFRGLHPNIPIYLGEEELPVVRWSDDYLRQMGYAGVSQYVETHATLLEDGDSVTLDELTFQVMHTPGHTVGGVIYYGKGVMFSGDTVFREEIGRCDLYTGNYQTMLATLKKIAALPGDYQIYPGHEQNTSLSHERKYNPYFIR